MNCPLASYVLVATPSSATAAVVLEALARLGVRPTVLSHPPEAPAKVAENPPRLLVIEPAGDDAPERLVSAVKADWPELPVVMVVQPLQAALVARVMRAGCDDVLTAPLDRPTVEAALGRWLASHPVELAQDDWPGLYQIAGRSRLLRAVLVTARKVAPTSMPVLISGESGTGKELVSHYLHRHSRRRCGPYVRVNCAALSDSLLESELFGHERGAFTGAVALRKGRFERAHGGTLLLDEISETGPRLQAELLRVLEQQDFERVGGSQTVRVNVRVVATSNRDLARDVEGGRFRRDLYYRISGVNLVVPPLRDRIEDLTDLVWHFVNLHAGESGRTIARLDAGMIELFERHSWPGNVRQLRNVVRTALSLGEGPVLSLRGAGALESRLHEPGAPVPAMPPLSLQTLEREAIFEALRRTKSHQAQAARILGISDRTLREKLRRYRQQETPLAAAGSAR